MSRNLFANGSSGISILTPLRPDRHCKLASYGESVSNGKQLIRMRAQLRKAANAQDGAAVDEVSIAPLATAHGTIISSNGISLRRCAMAGAGCGRPRRPLNESPSA